MIILWVCLILVVLNILVVAWAAHRVFSDRTLEAPAERDRPSSFADEEWLTLGEVIFDPSDYLWLRDDVCFPDAAELLAHHRRQLALRWLKSLEEWFKEIAATPGEIAAPGWRLFWSGLRFQFLLHYALIVVLLSGPYGRIVPPIPSLDALSRWKSRSHAALTSRKNF